MDNANVITCNVATFLPTFEVTYVVDHLVYRTGDVGFGIWI